MVVWILGFLPPDERLRCCGTCKRWLALRSLGAMWPRLQFRSPRTTGSAPRVSEATLARLSRILPLVKPERLELEDASHFKTVADIGFSKGWKLVLAKATGLKSLALVGSVFKVAALKLVGANFGATLEEFECRSNEAPLKVLVDNVLKKAENLKAIGVDHLSCDAAVQIADALPRKGRQIERLVVFKKSAYCDVTMDRAISFAFVVTALATHFPNLEEADLKQVVLAKTNDTNNPWASSFDDDHLLLQGDDDDDENDDHPQQGDDDDTNNNFDDAARGPPRRRRRRRGGGAHYGAAAVGGAFSPSDRARAYLLPSLATPVRPFPRLRCLSFSLRLTIIDEVSAPVMARAVGEILASACPALEVLRVDFEATVAASVAAPLLAGLAVSPTSRLQDLSVRGLHAHDVDTDAKHVVDVLASHRTTWPSNLVCCHVVFSDLPFFGLVSNWKGVSRAWTGYFRALFAKVADHLFTLDSLYDCAVSQTRTLKVGVVDRANLEQPSSQKKKKPTRRRPLARGRTPPPRPTRKRRSEEETSWWWWEHFTT